MNNFSKEIDKGIELLDSIDTLDTGNTPWYNRVKVNALDMSSGCRCVGGQLCGDYVFFKDELEKMGIDRSSETMEAHGFTIGMHVLIYSRASAWNELTRGWVEAITALRNGTYKAPLPERGWK